MKYRMPKYSKIFAGHDDGEKWTEFAKVAWTEVVSELDGFGLITTVRLRAIDRYVRVMTEYEMRYPAFSLIGPVREAENGNVYASVEWASLRNLSEQMIKLEESLLISPRSAKVEIDKKPAPKKSAASEFLNEQVAH